MESLAKRFGSKFHDMIFERGTLIVQDYIRVLVNGRHYGILPEKLDTLVQSGNDIGLFPPIAGG